MPKFLTVAFNLLAAKAVLFQAGAFAVGFTKPPTFGGGFLTMRLGLWLELAMESDPEKLLLLLERDELGSLDLDFDYDICFCKIAPTAEAAADLIWRVVASMSGVGGAFLGFLVICF